MIVSKLKVLELFAGKQAGNSIVVNVLEAILNNLLPTCQNQK